MITMSRCHPRSRYTRRPPTPPRTTPALLPAHRRYPCARRITGPNRHAKSSNAARSRSTPQGTRCKVVQLQLGSLALSLRAGTSCRAPNLNLSASVIMIAVKARARTKAGARVASAYRIIQCGSSCHRRSRRWTPSRASIPYGPRHCTQLGSAKGVVLFAAVLCDQHNLTPLGLCSCDQVLHSPHISTAALLRAPRRAKLRWNSLSPERVLGSVSPASVGETYAGLVQRVSPERSAKARGLWQHALGAHLNAAQEAEARRKKKADSWVRASNTFCRGSGRK